MREDRIKAYKKVCAKNYKVSIKDIDSEKRYRHISDARHMYWYLIHTLIGLTPTEMSYFINRTHATIYHGINKITSLIQYDSNTEIKYLNIMSDLQAF